MPRICDIQAETNDLSEFSEVDDTGAHASASAAAAMGSSRYGIQFAIVGTDAIRLKSSLAWTTKTIRFRFYFDPNGISLGSTLTRVIASLWNATDGNVLRVFFKDDSGMSIAVEYQEDGGGTTSTAFQSITDAPHYIEVELKRASSAGGSDGYVRFWVDDTLADTDSSLDIFDLGRPTEIRLVWDTNNHASDSGTLYFDELLVNNDGNPIGDKWLSTILARETFDGGLDHLSQQNLASRISTSSAAALAGSLQGVEFDLGAAGPFVGEVFSHIWTTDVLRCRIHLSLGSPSLSDVNARRVLGLWSAGFAAVRDGIEIKDDTTYQVRAFATEDASTATTSWYSITGSGDHYIEFEITRASSAVAADGVLKLWVDGVLKETNTGLDIFDQTRADGWLFEFANGVAGDVGVSMSLDEVEIRDKSRLIGSAVAPSRGFIAATADSVGFDYIDGTGKRTDQLGAGPSLFEFESYERPPDGDPDFFFGRQVQDDAGNVNRLETFFAGKLIDDEQTEVEPSRVSRWKITIADQRHEMSRTFLSQMITGNQRADQALLGALNGSGLTSAGWTLAADEGPLVDAFVFADTPMNEVMEHYAKKGGMLCWVSYDRVVNLRLPETLQSPHEIDREDPGQWHAHRLTTDRGRIANWVKGIGSDGKTAIQQDTDSQTEYGTRPATASIPTAKNAQLQSATLVILNARKDPIIHGTVNASYDRLAIGENLGISDLDAGFKHVAARISGLTWEEIEAGIWRVDLSVTNDTILAALVRDGTKVIAR